MGCVTEDEWAKYGATMDHYSVESTRFVATTFGLIRASRIARVFSSGSNGLKGQIDEAFYGLPVVRC